MAKGSSPNGTENVNLYYTCQVPKERSVTITAMHDSAMAVLEATNVSEGNGQTLPPRSSDKGHPINMKFDTFDYLDHMIP